MGPSPWPPDASGSEASRAPQAAERLDLNLLSVFDVVMTERHVTRAAERLDMTQSAVSNALNRPRRRYGDQLFIKAARGVEPTPRALALWPRIHQALEDLHSTVEPRDFDPARAEQRFRIAMADITAALIGPHLYRTVHAHSPETDLFFVPYDPATTGPRLMRGELDFAFTIEPARASVLQCMPLWKDRFVVAGRPGHPLLGGRLSLAGFCEAPQLVVNEPGDEEAAGLIDQALAERGLSRNVCLSVNQFSVVPTILRSSELLAVLPARFARSPHLGEGLVVAPLPFSLPEVVIYLCWHQRNNGIPAAYWLKQRLLEAATAVSTETDHLLTGR